MNKDPLVSIILPTYNVARFLKQCLDSLNIQTYTNYECILIVDGAIDGSYEIAKEYCESHNKFTVYWQENAGSGPARNNGIDHANGELIMFIDPDDWVEPDFVERHVEEQQKGDYDFTVSQRTEAFCNDKGTVLKEKIIPIKEYFLDNKDRCRESYLTFIEEGLINAPTRKVYKRDIIIKNNIRFPDLRRSQDIVFNYRYYNCINTAKSFKYNGYYYRVVNGENLSRVKPEHYKILRVLYSDIKDLHAQWGIKHSNTRIANYFMRVVYTCLLSNMATQNPIEPILNDAVVSEILDNAKPDKIHFRIVRWCARNNKFLLKRVLNLLVWAKSKKEV